MASANLFTPEMTAEKKKQQSLVAGEAGLFTQANEASKSFVDSRLTSANPSGYENYTSAGNNTPPILKQKQAEAEAKANAAEENLKKRQSLLGADYGSAFDIGNSQAMRRSLLGVSATTFGN
jgi:hypothetical protein